MFAMGETDEYPLWALPLLARRLLWKEYGIPFEDFEFEDVLIAMRLQKLETDRDNYQIEKMKK